MVRWMSNYLIFAILIKRLPWTLSRFAGYLFVWKWGILLMPADAAFKTMFTDDKLIAVFLAHFGYYCENPSKACLLTAMLVHEHYLHGGYYPIGGS